MSTSALESQGMLLQSGDGASPEVFTTIPEITDIGGPDGSATEIDTTDLSSTAKEFKIGLKDEGQVSITMTYIPANTVHSALRTDRNNRTLRNFKLKFTDSPNTVWSFSAYVLGFSVTNAVDGATQASVTLRISGAITEA